MSFDELFALPVEELDKERLDNEITSRIITIIIVCRFDAMVSELLLDAFIVELFIIK